MSRSARADSYKLWRRAQEAKGDPASNRWLVRDAFYAAWDGQQAKIDRLMIEFCPEEMTADQKATWTRHQRVVEDAPSAAGGEGKEGS